MMLVSPMKIFQVLTLDLDYVNGKNDEYTDKSPTRLFQVFNNTYIYRYLCQRKVLRDKISEFKQYFTPFLKNFTIKPVCGIVNNPQ